MDFVWGGGDVELVVRIVNIVVLPMRVTLVTVRVGLKLAMVDSNSCITVCSWLFISQGVGNLRLGICAMVVEGNTEWRMECLILL